MVDLENKRNRMYYVDNDFYKNKYKFIGYNRCKYFQIIQRKIEEWNIYSEYQTNTKIINIDCAKSKKILTK